MSDTDSFIDEVTEEVRRDRLFALMRKYGWIGILAVVLIVGGAAWNEWQKARAQASAESFGDAVTAAVQSDDPAAALAGIATEGGQKAVVAFLGAAQAMEAEDAAGAAEALRAIAADASLPTSYRHLAQLKLILIAGDTMDVAERDAVLAEIATPGAPFRALALEQQALVLVAAGDTEAAIAALRALLLEPELTAGLQARASQLIVALGGNPDAA